MDTNSDGTTSSGARKGSSSGRELLILVLILLTGGAAAAWVWRDRLRPVNEEVAQPAPPPAPIARPLPVLRAALRSQDRSTRLQAARELGGAISSAVKEGAELDQTQQAVDALTAATGDAEPEVGSAASTSLAVSFRARPASGGESPLDPKAAVAALGHRLESKDRGTRTATLAALSAIGRAVPASAPPELLAALDRGTPEEQDHVALALASFRQGVDPAIARMFQAFEKGQPGTAGIMNAGLAAIRPSPAVVPLLIEKLQSPRLDVRTHAARMLGRIGPEARDSIPALLALLASSDPRGIEGLEVAGDYRGYSPVHDNAAEGACQAIGRIVSGTEAAPAVVDQLATALKGAPASHRRVYAFSLGLCGKDAAPAVPALAEVLHTEIAEPSAPGTGQRLAWSLGQIAPGTPQAGTAVAALTDALSASETPTVLAAANALGGFGPDANPAVPRLREMLKKPEVALPADRALERLGIDP